MNQVFDVVQVGYGPVGQVLAAGLGRRGHRVQVLERHHQRYAVSRAGTFDHEVMRTLQGLGVAEELERKLARPLGMAMMDAGGRVLTQVAAHRDVVSGWHGSYTMYQPDLEDALDRVVRAEPSVEVLMGWVVDQVVPAVDHVVVESRHRETGERRTSRGRYVIGADGANSAVRELAGFVQEDLGYRGPWLVIDFEHHDPAVSLPLRDGFVLDPRRPALLGRWLGRRHSRMEFMLAAGESPEDMTAEDRCWELAAPWGVTPATSRIARRAVYEFGSQLVKDWRRGRVLLAGDAAHVMPPFLGQGFCAGVRDAANLTWKLDLVVRGEADEALLDTYTRERRPHVEQVIRMAMALGAMVSTTDQVTADRRDAALSGSGVPPTPSLPGLVDGVLRPGAGGLALQARVERDGERGRLDDLIGGGWRILTRRPVPVDALTDRRSALLDRLGAEIVVISPVALSGGVVDVDLDYEAWFDELNATAVIVRPDFYLYAALPDLAVLGEALDDLARELELT
ncbi:bifunctional 3-(3-hydroxy-phenyl)propionate/3-hydroxycinnamic acid hydroxylase [Lentzea sp. HUAS12]|uniref:bifunctional 3-(3-hydroxy-phenyl)propionate/3-hydroxycinnamic acid hydroxylase n=1 Tax=Lentzea sp. HUAS12 TaxID=2951806 RepID=UPI00209F17C1|nr:bifunctional 3-(3-hydroxy-phenyl)propionate/3-hydroxycinnamic acid hydroxylase [Lentzea sp. HUAS12]USX56300.1 bifunctional 3-(3-hydroxy-phenyl)propionate/3-hydroxycinnamic acid hydroxylase [Lentzea sp. HUAS12]